MQPAHCFSRRSFFGSVAAVIAPSLSSAQSPPDDHGRVKPPIPVPDVALVRHDGVATTLPALVNRRATAVQLMFTSCTMTCPIQGAIFERVQRLIPDQVARGIQLLSLSVDPRNDTPEALRNWLHRFHAGPAWIAAAPRVNDTERVRAFGGPGRNPADNHSTQVHLLNREGLLVWRTFELPEAEEIAAILRKM
jgi:protein SCO1/2